MTNYLCGLVGSVPAYECHIVGSILPEADGLFRVQEKPHKCTFHQKKTKALIDTSPQESVESLRTDNWALSDPLPIIQSNIWFRQSPFKGF